MCTAAAVPVAVGATSAGGLIAIVVKKLLSGIRMNGIRGINPGRVSHDSSNRTSENRVTR